MSDSLQTSKPHSLLHPGAAVAEPSPACQLTPAENQKLTELKGLRFSNTNHNAEMIANWQGNFIWMQGPRGSKRTEILETRIKKVSEYLLASKTARGHMLLVTPYNRQAEQWRLWAQEQKINLRAHTPESLAHTITTDHFKELGYETPPEWADHRIKILIQDIWNDIKQQMNGLIDKIDATRETKILGNTQITIIREKPEQPRNFIQYAGNLSQIFHQRLAKMFREQGVINNELAHHIITVLLESRADLRIALARRHDTLFLEEPEAMDQSLFDWLQKISFPSIFVTSCYSLRNPACLYPRLHHHWANPDGRDPAPNLSWFGTPISSWKEPKTYIPVRNQFQESITLSYEGWKPQTFLNRKTAAETAANGLHPKSRLVHLTLWPSHSEPDPGQWITQNILRFLRIWQKAPEWFRPNENPQAENPFEQKIFNSPESRGFQAFLSQPAITQSDHPDIHKWRSYLESTFPQLVDLNLDIRYLSLSEGPVNRPKLERPTQNLHHTLWIGTPLALNGCELDLILIPKLENLNWPQAEATAWDWLDLCASKARIATCALSKFENLPPHFLNTLPLTAKTTTPQSPLQTKLRFEPLFKQITNRKIPSPTENTPTF
jgi:hypothetical protein